MTQQFEVVGRITDSSNLSYLVSSGDFQYIYKPISGERELWDFPTGTLALREVAAYLLSEALGWSMVPETFLAEGPSGVGSFQKWISHSDEYIADLFDPAQVPDEFVRIIDGVDETGKPITLAHLTADEVARIAVFDALANNADRKAGHLLVGEKIWAIDHGVTFHSEFKLRTVLWGWHGQEIPSEILADLDRLRQQDLVAIFGDYLSEDELVALSDRLDELILTKKFAEPSPNWPAIPWPIF